MNIKDLVMIAMRDSKDKLSCFAVGDLYEELGNLDMAFAWRWMGIFKKRPGYRTNLQRSVNYWAWYREFHTTYQLNDQERARANKTPYAILNQNIFCRIQRIGSYATYRSKDKAIEALAGALRSIRELIEDPNNFK